jgi:RNA polymerase sigma-70 factor, ECF subfamily
MSLPPAGELFDRYAAMVYRRCRQMLGAPEAARDAVQDVFLRVIERGHLFRGDSSPSTWLYAMATLHCLQRLRDRAARGQKLDELAAAPRAAAGSPIEDRLTVLRLLDGQTDDVRLIVYLRLVDGMTMEEVAALVGHSRKTVSQRMQTFLDAARSSLRREAVTP